ncbi:MAG: hypothetical protein WA631_20260, partial [Nitrososphaeraceae archaeon]
TSLVSIQIGINKYAFQKTHKNKAETMVKISISSQHNSSLSTANMLHEIAWFVKCKYTSIAIILTCPRTCGFAN